MRKLCFYGFALILLLSGCSSDDAVNGGPTLTQWTGTVASSSRIISFTSETSVPRADGGVSLTLTGNSVTDKVTATLDISGSVKVVIPTDNPATSTNEAQATVQVGISGINLNITIGDVKYRATSGTITFTAFGSTVGSNVTGSVDVGMVSVNATTSTAAALKGDFATTVEAAVTP